LEKDSPGGLSDVATIQYKGNRNTQVTSMPAAVSAAFLRPSIRFLSFIVLTS
jgi:UTP:GlnB (protein PII) uridylyltransferase